MSRMSRILTVWLLVAGVGSLSAAEPIPVVKAWLAGQSKIQTWSADFVQTRALKSLMQPLKSSGHVWFAAPNRFRWELGSPPQTIAVRAKDELQILYPRLKRVEKFPLSGEQQGPWRDALALLEAGFPRSEEQLQAQYNITAQNVTGQTCEVVLEPKSASAKKMIPQIKIDFDTQDFSLRGTELKFADGSTMRNDFKNPILNPKIEPSIFEPPIPADYKVVEPLKR